jgi:hypothetical protein
MKKHILIMIVGIFFLSSCGHYTGRGLLVKKKTKRCAECPKHNRRHRGD